MKFHKYYSYFLKFFRTPKTKIIEFVLYFMKQKIEMVMIQLLIKLKKFNPFTKKIWKKETELDIITRKFEKWTNEKKQKYKIKEFLEPDFIPIEKDTSHCYAIQQVKKEIFEFAKIILERSLTHTILEIGLGYHGGTHIFWKLIFDKVITIEIDMKNIKRFVINENISNRDIFIIGNSNSLEILRKVINKVKSVDVLFIDGNHKYGSVKKIIYCIGI